MRKTLQSRTGIENRTLGIYHYRSEKPRQPNREILHVYDLPRAMLERWQWVIDWRKAKLVCKNIPVKKYGYINPYDKRTGLQTEFNYILGECHRQRHRLQRLKGTLPNTLNTWRRTTCFLIETDEQLLKANVKLEQKKANYNEIYALLQEEVIKHKKTVPCINYL